MTPHVADIQAAVCQQYGITRIEMVSHRLNRHAAGVRPLGMYLFGLPH